MKKVLMILGILLVVLFFIFIFKNINNSSDDNKTSESNNAETTHDKTQKTSNNTNKESFSKAKNNAETYLVMAYKYKLNTEYKEEKDIFSETMYKQLQKYDESSKGKKYGENENIERSVNEIKIYFDSDDEYPKTALYTAKIVVNDTKEKNKMIRNVTGRVTFVDENGQPKIDSSEEINTQQTEE